MPTAALSIEPRRRVTDCFRPLARNCDSRSSGVGKQCSGLIQKNSPVAGESDAARRAINESRRQLFFKELDVPTKCGRQSFRVSAPRVRNAVPPPPPRNIVVAADPCARLPTSAIISFFCTKEPELMVRRNGSNGGYRRATRRGEKKIKTEETACRASSKRA